MIWMELLANTLDSMAYVANEILDKFGLERQPVENFKYYSGEGRGYAGTPLPERRRRSEAYTL